MQWIAEIRAEMPELSESAYKRRDGGDTGIGSLAVFLPVRCEEGVRRCCSIPQLGVVFVHMRGSYGRSRSNLGRIEIPKVFVEDLTERHLVANVAKRS